MTETSTTSAPLTVRSLLFEEAATGADLLAQAIDEEAVAAALPQLSRAGRAAAGAELTDMAKGLLELDLGSLALAGWRKHHDLLAAATRTAEHPGSTELVELATHRITSTHRPTVDVLVDGARVAVVRLELEVVLLVRALVATVRRGHLIGLRSGSVDVRLSLSVAGRQVAAHRTTLASPLFVRLGDGIPLPVRIRTPAGGSALTTPPDAPHDGRKGERT
jgi:hypothetical protein